MGIATDLGAAVRRFPLVPRHRPACLPLAERIQRQLTEPADAVASEPDAARALALAASVMNQAALLASDCGRPDLARHLCWQQFHAFQAGWPLDAPSARHCLEPLVNLARLQVRAGDGGAGYRTIESLYRAVTSGASATVDGRTLTFDGLVATDEDHRAVSQWLWTVVLADGIRALASEGRWQDAAAQGDRHGGIGHRLLDGRQVAILACCADGDLGRASALLDASEPSESWEHAVGACLAVLCARHAGARARDVQTMTARYLQLGSEPGLAPFRARLGMTMLSLARHNDDAGTGAIARRVVGEATASRDGRLAAEVLSTGRLRAHTTPGELAALASLRAAAGLEAQALSGGALARVERAVASSLAVVRCGLDASAGEGSSRVGRWRAAGDATDDCGAPDSFNPVGAGHPLASHGLSPRPR